MKLHKYIFSGTYRTMIQWVLCPTDKLILSDGLPFHDKYVALEYCKKNNIKVSDGGVFSNYKCYGEPVG